MRNQLKITSIQEEKLAEPVTEEIVEQAPKKGNKVTRTVSSLMSGRFLISETTLKYLPFVMFLAFLSLLYIANGYYAQAKDRELDKLNSELGELRTQYVIAKSKLMYLSKESEVAKAASDMGIKEALVPPDKIVVNNNKSTKR
jgi:hypothetical protein